VSSSLQAVRAEQRSTLLKATDSLYKQVLATNRSKVQSKKFFALWWLCNKVMEP
jgi:hypothetical protein